MTESPQPPSPLLTDPAAMLDWLRQSHAAGRRVPLLHFYGHHARSQGPGPWVFSQWWPVRFTIDGVTYRHAEGAMMAGKARLFGDDDALERILAAEHPLDAKTAGRAVRGFDQMVWDAHAFELVVNVNVAKFSQHPDLAAYLRGTAPAVLVEASPKDRIWGIGLRAGDPAAHDARRWCGQNLLGFALTRARRLLTD